MTNRKDYLKRYDEEHYEYRRLYRTEWQRLRRKGLLSKITVFEYIEKKLNFRIYKVKEGHCNRCDILLISEYAEGHDGKTCGDCLKRKPKMEEKTRWACWDCQKEFKPTERKRSVIDEGTPTTVCNKCYSKRLDEKNSTKKEE